MLAESPVAATKTTSGSTTQHGDTPSWLGDLLGRLESAVVDFSVELTNSGTFAQAQEQTPAGRQSDIFPLPLLPASDDLITLPHCADSSPQDLVDAVGLANVTIRALNVLVGGRTPGPVIARTAPQRQSQGMVLIKALRLIMRARSAAEPLEGRTAWASLIDDQDELPNPAFKSKRVADRCDLL